MPRLITLLFASTLATTGCADVDDVDDVETSDPEVGDLEDGLSLGKADDLGSGVRIRSFGVSLRGAAARTLNNALHDSDARAITAGGNRILLASGVGCISNGLETYCEMIGFSEPGNDTYEAIIHGQHRSAAATIYNLIGDGQTSFVEVPWFACEQSGSATWCGVEASEGVTIEFDGLEDSGDDFVYEGWAVFGGVPTTTDRFRNGPVVNQRVPRSIAGDSLYVLTIEPRRGDASAPAATHLVAGALDAGGQTELTTAHPAALGTDFADADGGFILATPSSASMDDETSGVWFVDPAVGEPSLTLPTLPQGWTYEGWVVSADGPISTGRFTSVMGADSDGGGPAAGPNATPPFPGQDFVSPPLDLIGTTVVISVEPEPDNSPAPFAIKPLIDATVENVSAPQLQSLGNTSENRPSAVATFATH